MQPSFWSQARHQVRPEALHHLVQPSARSSAVLRARTATPSAILRSHASADVSFGRHPRFFLNKSHALPVSLPPQSSEQYDDRQ